MVDQPEPGWTSTVDWQETYPDIHNLVKRVQNASANCAVGVGAAFAPRTRRVAQRLPRPGDKSRKGERVGNRSLQSCA